MDNEVVSMEIIFSNLFPYGLFDESEPISLMFKLIFIGDLFILLLLQICVAVRTIIFDGQYSVACAQYVLLNWLKGVGLSIFVITSPLSLIFFYRAFSDALTAHVAKGSHN